MSGRIRRSAVLIQGHYASEGDNGGESHDVGVDNTIKLNPPC